jgi:putative ABC transport system permease protein
MNVLRGSYFNSQRGMSLKKGLVTFQFFISTTMIIASIVIAEQLNFIRQKKLGFNPENVLMLPNVRGAKNPEAMEKDFEKLASVISVARADGILGIQNSTNGVASKNQNNHIALNFMRVDYEFLPALKIELKEGRNFSNQFTSDSTGIIINENAVAELGLHEPLSGQQLVWDDENGSTHDVTIIGVAKDFHFSSFHEAIKPFGFILEVANGSTFFLKINSTKPDRALREVEKVWTKHNPDKPFEYSFQDERLAQLHVSERNFEKLFSSFTILAITIASLGLFGLVTYLTEAKTKEIGIRKTLGASVKSVVALLSKDFLVLASVAFVIASPVAYYMMQNWLESFAYHVTIGWSVFASGGIISLAIALTTVSFRTIEAALENPIESLRSE